MIFGFGRGRREEVEEQEEEVELVSFQGALNGKPVSFKENARLAQAGLGPAKEMVTDALVRRAERIRLEPKGKMAAVTLYIDGVPYPGGRMASQQALAVTQVLKLLAGLDIRQRKRPQSGGIKAEFDEAPYELGVASTPVEAGGERLMILARNLKQEMNTPEEVGISPELKAKIRELMAQKEGVFLICGPPYSGTTTTAFAALRAIDAYMYQVYSIADTGSREMVNVTPFERHPEENLDTALDRCVRMDADVIFLDPLRDAEIARIMFNKQKKVALMSEVAAKSPSEAILRLIQWLEDPRQVASGLQGILSQKLIRLLCERCREAYRPNPKLIAKMGLPKETKVLYRPPRQAPTNERGEELEPCRDCGGIGYFGRAGLFELIEMTESMRKLVASRPDAAAIKAQARKEKMPSLQAEGVRLVGEGRTSLEELQRAFKQGT